MPKGSLEQKLHALAACQQGRDLLERIGIILPITARRVREMRADQRQLLTRLDVKVVRQYAM